ncbi:GatB/YqeY domain-containing protein [Leeia sp. TBRC 13508]|uniref:GatB/YqeY domain-containing protein n=1 Tax=Leeia speluncae TaxID=2884804 RepID=A0ABS8D995_9NEIS|nr:GatB/YqeY domain-containing protein [Leeia speluncae]MCB6184770.1 GatB/YqeY domain-containing protein [Leeia speluncae]
MSLKQQILDDIKAAMRSKEMQRLGALRLLSSEIKQKEVDQRIELADADIIAIISKMLKQRKDSISQFDAAGRTDLADAERAEVVILQAYLPASLSEGEIRQVVEKAVAESGLTGPQAMGKVMPVLKAELAGKADMSVVSAILKEVLAG